MNIVELDETYKEQLIELIRSVAIGHVLPTLGAAGKQHYLEKIEPDVEFCFANKFGKYLAILEGEEIVGICGFSTRGHIAQLFVRSSDQGKGIGKKLLDHAIGMCNCVIVTVNASINAAPFYKGQGFDPTDKEKSSHGILFLPMARPNN